MAWRRSGLVATVMVLLLLPLVGVTGGNTAEQIVYWAVSHGGGREEGAWSVEDTDDGGCVVAGWTESFGGRLHGWILKLRQDSSIEWQYAYGKDWDLASLIQQTSDGGYAVAGTTYSFGAGGIDFWVLKLRADGSVQWQKAFGGRKDEWGVSVQETTDGGYLVAGETESFGAGDWDMWLIKLDKDGKIEWEKTYGGKELETTSAEPIEQTADGGYVVTGQTASWGKGDTDFWVLKLDEEGAVEWQKAFGGSREDHAHSIKQTPDGGYVVAGNTQSFGAGNKDVWVLKLDRDGIVQWQKTYGGSGSDWTYSIQVTGDGGYVFAGETRSFGQRGDAWIVKLREDGKVQWQRIYGGEDWDGAVSVRQGADGGYFAAGDTNSFGAGTYDYWVLKLDRQGRIPGCPLMADSEAIVKDTEALGVESDAEPIPSEASVEDTTVTPDDTRASSSTECSAVEPASVSLAKSVLSPVAAPGQPVTFTLSFSNTGLSALANVTISDVVPAELENVSFASSWPLTPTGSFSYTWALGDLAPGAQGQIELYGSVPRGPGPGYSFTNTACIEGVGVEADPSDNCDWAAVAVGPAFHLYLPLVVLHY